MKEKIQEDSKKKNETTEKFDNALCSFFMGHKAQAFGLIALIISALLCLASFGLDFKNQADIMSFYKYNFLIFMFGNTFYFAGRYQKNKSKLILENMRN